MSLTILQGQVAVKGFEQTRFSTTSGTNEVDKFSFFQREIDILKHQMITLVDVGLGQR